MAFNPEERPTAEQAIRHPWLIKFSKAARDYVESIEKTRLISSVSQNDTMTNLCLVWEDSKDISATERFKGA